MKQYIFQRVLDIADYIIDTNCTIRQAGKQFNQCKSTVHKDMQQRLPLIDNHRYMLVCHVLGVNSSERHIRGGLATKNKYKNQPVH